MSARTVAMLLASDEGTRGKIEDLLARHHFSDREAEAVLLLTEMFLAGFVEAGGSVNEEVTIRAGAKAVDTVWVRRETKEATR